MTLGTSGKSRLQRLKRVLVPVLVLFHLAAVSIANLPENNGLGKILHAGVNPYLRFFGQWQEWDMFTTIPLYEDLQASLLVRDATGAEQLLPPMLPGFEAQPDSLRIMSMFARLVWARKGFNWHAQRFHRAACAAVTERLGSKPRSVRVQLNAKALRSVSNVKKTGIMADPKVFKSEELACP